MKIQHVYDLTHAADSIFCPFFALRRTLTVQGIAETIQPNTGRSFVS